MTVPVFVTFHYTNKSMWGEKEEFCLNRERTQQKKITRLENAVMHKRFLCRCNNIMPFLLA